VRCRIGDLVVVGRPDRAELALLPGEVVHRSGLETVPPGIRRAGTGERRTRDALVFPPLAGAVDRAEPGSGAGHSGDTGHEERGQQDRET
jgi:hypothetical protein